MLFALKYATCAAIAAAALRPMANITSRSNMPNRSTNIFMLSMPTLVSSGISPKMSASSGANWFLKAPDNNHAARATGSLNTTRFGSSVSGSSPTMKSSPSSVSSSTLRSRASGSVASWPGCSIVWSTSIGCLGFGLGSSS